MPQSARPLIERIDPPCALPSGEVHIFGSNLKPTGYRQPRVDFSGETAHLSLSSSTHLVVRVPEEGTGPVIVTTTESSEPAEVTVATLLSNELHPITSPAVAPDGNIYTTVSGSRGESVPVSIYRVDPTGEMTPFVMGMMSASALAFGPLGDLYVTSRHSGDVFLVSPEGGVSIYASGMGVATGLAFDRNGNLYVGDRSGTIFKIAADRHIYVFATLEPSISAYHLAFADDGCLYVTGPTISTRDNVWRIDPDGVVSLFFRGLGRPQGLAFDINGNLLVTASLHGRRGVVSITPQGEAALVIAGSSLVGLAFLSPSALALTTTNSLFVLAWNVGGRPLI